jgi:hypothetical protein
MTAAAEAAGADRTLPYGGRDRASMAFTGQLAARHGDKTLPAPWDEAGPPDLAPHLGSPAPDALVHRRGPPPRAAGIRHRAWPVGEEATCGASGTDAAEGEVDHRDSVLTNDEHASSETAMTLLPPPRLPAFAGPVNRNRP